VVLCVVLCGKLCVVLCGKLCVGKVFLSGEAHSGGYMFSHNQDPAMFWVYSASLGNSGWHSEIGLKGTIPVVNV